MWRSVQKHINPRLVQTLTHVFTIALIGIVLWFMISSDTNQPRKWNRTAFLMGFTLVMFYINYLLLVPRLFFKREYISYTVSVLILLAISIAIPMLLGPDGFDRPRFRPGPPPGLKGPPKGLLLSVFFLFTLIAIALSLSIRLLQRWRKQDQREQQARASKLEMEMSLLRNQISPHFFFNTLNTIYSLTETDAEKARLVIQELSEMMRYLIYESSSSGRVALSREVEFISNYIGIMTTRLADSVHIRFEKSIANDQVQIAPLLFISLIENVFKHGIRLDEDTTIHITLYQQDDLVELITENPITSNTLNRSEASGIGIENLKRRLNLIFEPGEYTYTVETTRNRYRARLSFKTWS